MNIENYDKNFVLEEFLGYASNVFVKLFKRCKTFFERRTF